jgi:hypothetical protein
MHHYGNLDAIKIVRDAITANVDLLMWKPQIFSMYMQMKNCAYIKPNTMLGKTGYKWHTRLLKIHRW